MSIQARWNVRLAVATAMGLSVVAGIAPHVHAGPISYSVIEPDDNGRWIERLVEPGELGVVPQGEVIENYDNFRSPEIWDGQTIFDGRFVQVGDREVGDDLVLSGYQAGIVDSAGFTRTNLSIERFMINFDLDLRFYRSSDLALLGEVLFTVVGAVPLEPGGRRFTYVEPGGLRSFGIRLDSEVFMTVKYTNVQGVRAEDVGQLVGGPINTGSSSSLYRDFTLGQNLDLGETPQANLGLSVRTVVPSPSGVGLLVATASGLLRRRR